MKYKHQKLGVDWQVIRISDGWQMAICQDEGDADNIAFSLNAVDTIRKSCQFCPKRHSLDLRLVKEG